MGARTVRTTHREPDTVQYAWTCPCCGQPQSDLPLDIGAAKPDAWIGASEAEQAEGFLSSDICYLGPDNFLRVCLELPIQGRNEVFTYGVWVSLSDASLDRVRALWSVPVPEDEPSKFAWLNTEIADFRGSAGLKGCIWLRNNNQRPRLELEPTDHPLARAQREGLTLDAVLASVARHMPGHRAETAADAVVQKDNIPTAEPNTGSNPVASSRASA